MSSDAPNTIRFWVNDEEHVVADADPRMLLLDYLRSDDVGLTGTKHVCGQGGCGACTVMLSSWDEPGQTVDHRAINSCLRPLCAVDGMAVTTIEGVGSVTKGLSPVQYQLAVDNGSQCGYCSPGWVMNMHSFLVANEGRDATREQVEALFDGNLCRCTGYRPILHAMRHFASDWSPTDDGTTMTCVPMSANPPRVADPEPNTVPVAVRRSPRAFSVERDGYTWLRVSSMADLETVLRKHGSVDDVKLIVGNTSIGIYGEPDQGISLGSPHLRIDISAIPDLNGFSATDHGLVVGAATTYSELLRHLGELIDVVAPSRRSGVEALRYMAQRTAGRIVRDAASLAGNTMLVVRNVGATRAANGSVNAPFPSDLFTALCMLDATVDVTCPAWKEIRRLGMLDFAESWQNDKALQRGAVILRYHVPFTRKHEWARTYKVALREVNAHSIVNAGLTVRFADNGRVAEARAVFGGIGPIAFRASGLESYLQGRRWNDESLAGALAHARSDIAAQIDASAKRMADVLDEGFTSEYRAHLAETFVYQHFVWVAETVAPAIVSPTVASAGARVPRPLSHGSQTFATDPSLYPVTQPIVKAEAFLQVTGEAVYTHDAPTPTRGLDAALVVSTRPDASFGFGVVGDDGVRRPADGDALADDLRVRFPDFVDLVTARDVPGLNDQAPPGYPTDPLICVDATTACGQVLAIVLAANQQSAIDIAWWVQNYCVEYGPAPSPSSGGPVFTLQEAIVRGNFLHEAPFNIASITRPNSKLGWTEMTTAELGGVECAVVTGSQTTNAAQMHFYMETQSAIATPRDGGRMTVLCSTQNPDTIHRAVVGALGVSSNQVDVRIERVGGGYGGKGPRSPWAAVNAAVAAHKMQRPVRLAVTRETDSALFGHDSPLRGDYRLAIGIGRTVDGADDPHSRGRLLGLQADLYVDAGNTADCTPVVLDCVQLRFDNGYMIPNYQTTGKVCLTNTISNTSFRSLDAVSGITVLEDAIEAAAYELGLVPEQVREQNLYRIGDFTPYGEELAYCYLADVWAYTRKRANFDARRDAVDRFNREHRWVKRGISMIPIKYGMGFNTSSMERGDALVEVYEDGSVLVHHGGVEIGQGVNTQVIQLVAQALGVSMDRVRVDTTSTAVIPNPESTGASTGTAFNGGAAQKGAQILRQRLERYCLGLLRTKGRAWCSTNHVDFWNFDDGWSAVVCGPDGPTPMWTLIVKLAAQDRIDLSVQAQHNETGGTRADTGLLNQQGTDPGADNFVGYTYSVACTEVEVDILTGEVQILRADLVYDMGQSINPATDVGQIEGAFVQGIGRVLTENLVVQPTGLLAGRNNTPNTWGYKIPAATTVPIEMHVDLYPRSLSDEVPDNPNLLMSAKEVGEPPLCMATTVYFAVKHAILASREQRGKLGWFALDMPCTVQQIREKCEVTADELRLGVSPAVSGGCGADAP